MQTEHVRRPMQEKMEATLLGTTERAGMTIHRPCWPRRSLGKFVIGVDAFLVRDLRRNNSLSLVFGSPRFRLLEVPKK